MTVTVDESGRILLPEPVRDRLGLTPGTLLVLDVHDTGDVAPTVALRREDATALAQDGPILVHRGRLTDANFDAEALLRDQRTDRARKQAGLGGDER